MHRLEWKVQAEEDLIQIAEYIEQDSPDSADKLVADIDAKTLRLREHPNLYRPGRKRGTRELVAHENYIVVYRVLTSEKKIEILRVLHAAQQWP